MIINFGIFIINSLFIKNNLFYFLVTRVEGLNHLNLVIQQDQLADGGRKITKITQVNGLKDGWANLEDIFYYDIERVDKDGLVHGRFKATGVVPSFYPIFGKRGVALAKELFNKD